MVQSASCSRSSARCSLRSDSSKKPNPFLYKRKLPLQPASYETKKEAAKTNTQKHRKITKKTFFNNLKCRECGRLYEKEAIHICEFDFGPLEAAYDYDAIHSVLTRELIESRPQTMWRYRELLPIDGEPTVGTQVGFTPLVKAD